MPSKNSIKSFEVDSMYHVYNRGNNKRNIFIDEQDYSVFLSYLKYALLSSEEVKASEQVDRNLISEAQQFNLRRMGLEGKLELVSYCLMPNHFHLLFYQHDIDAITKIMRSIATGYVMYFNKRHDSSGRLFQGVYKASRIADDSYWQHISRYIHLNPVDLGVDFRDYDYSSYKYYSTRSEAAWVKPDKGMNGMGIHEYEKFVVDWIPQRNDMKPAVDR